MYMYESVFWLFFTQGLSLWNLFHELSFDVLYPTQPSFLSRPDLSKKSSQPDIFGAFQLLAATATTRRARPSDAAKFKFNF